MNLCRARCARGGAARSDLGRVVARVLACGGSGDFRGGGQLLDEGCGGRGCVADLGVGLRV